MKPAPKRSTVLAVNDEPGVLELLTVLLEHEGYRVVAASNGRLALELALSIEPDLVISDVVMPEMDGIEFCRALKQNARTAYMPVLLVSAVRTAAGDTLHGLAAGADDYLEIPFRRQELLVKVARLIERHRIERHYRELVEQAADIIYTRDMEGRITSINEAGARFFGRGVEEIVGASLGELIGEEAAAREIARSLESNREESLRTVHYLKDAHGVPHYLEEVTTLVRDAQGQPTSARAVVRDITERKEAEEKLRESEKQLATAQQIAHLGSWEWNIETGEVSWSDELYRIFGLKSAGTSVTYELYLSYVHPEDRQSVKDAIELAVEERRSFNYECRVVRPDGNIRIIQAHGEIVLDDAGQPQKMFGTCQDITERRQAEEERRRSEQKYRDIFNNATMGIYQATLDGSFITANATLARMLGYSLPEELMRRNLGDDIYFFKEDRERLIKSYGTGSRAEEVELLWKKKDGSPIWVHLNANAIKDSQGNILYLDGFVHDITESKRADEALAQQAEREALINRISSAVRRSLNPADVFRTAVTELGSHLGADRCLLFMHDAQAGLVRTVAEYRAPGVRPGGRDYDSSLVGDLITGLRQVGVLTFDDVANDEHIRPIYDRILRSNGVRSIMYVAISVGDETPACFSISTTRSLRTWEKTDIDLARAVADQTGIAIRQAELYQKAEATSQREALINRLSLAVRASLSLPEVLSTATQELGHALNASRVHLHLYDPQRTVSPVEHEYVAPGVMSIRHIESSYDDPFGQKLLRSTQPIVIDDALNYSSGTHEFDAYVRAHASLLGLRSQINCPLIINGRFRGAVCIHQTDRVRHWTQDEIALVEAVAAQLAIGISQAELFELAQRAKKEWETTFNAMSDGIFIFDNAGQLIRVNRAGASLEDTWPHLLLGRKCCDILRTSGDEQTCVVEKTIASGRSTTVEIIPERLNRPLLVTIEPVVEGASGTVGAVCTARDLSELRQAEAVARERQSLLTNILESVREPIYAIDTRGRILWCNSAIQTAGGYKPDDLVGHHFLEMVYPADRELAKANFESALEGETQSFEARYQTRDGEVRYALFDNAPLVTDDCTTGVLCLARDITEQKQQRQRSAQADKLRALGQLASGVAHDFNNALAAILGRAQLMRREQQSDSMSRNLDIIQTAAEDAAATVRRIQTFARQSQGAEFELLDMSSLLYDAIEITRTRWENEARMRGLDYEVTLNAPSPLYAHGNASELREVFVNLIVNAVDAMPYGGRLSISCEQVGQRLHLRFEDTGTGMTEDVKEKIFEPFYTTKGAHGTGLGLAVSYGIIERHEGQITVESEIGRGTTFLIELAAAETKEVQEDTLETQPDTPSLKVLVVDDEHIVRETLAEMLTTLSHKVSSVGSGREALAVIEREHFDLVFTDLSMPEMDGWEVARALRRRDPEIRIVLVTGYGKGTLPPDGERGIINGVIGKPFDFALVTETIAKVTEKVSEVKV